MVWKIGIGILIFMAVLLITGFLLPEITELRHEIKIAAKKDKVWDVLSNLEAVQHYNPTVQKAHYVSQLKTGIGAARQCDLKDGGFVKETITGWEPKEAVTMQLTESPWPVTEMNWRTQLTAQKDFVLVSQVLTYKMKMGPIGKLLNFLVLMTFPLFSDTLA